MYRRSGRPASLSLATSTAIIFLAIAGSTAAAAATHDLLTTEFSHTGGGPTSAVMASIISKLPPVTPPKDGVRDGGKLMRTVHLSGDYQGDVPLILVRVGRFARVFVAAHIKLFTQLALIHAPGA